MKITLITFFLSFFVNCYSQEYINDISYPSKTYLLDGVSNKIYFQSFIKRWRPYEDFVRIKMKSKTIHTGKELIIDKPIDGDIMNVTLVNGDEFKEIKNIKSEVCVGSPYKGNDTIYIQFLGDSFTKGLFFKYAFLESGYVPLVKLVGTREIEGWKGYFHEGRGGWTLKHYFSNRTNDQYFYNPFWQPQGNFKYWGSTSFWKNCIYLTQHDSKKIDNFSLTYSCSGYNVSDFSSDGKRKVPQDGDLMWDSDKQEYITWKHNKWIEIDAEKLQWNFDYGKYIKMHRLSPPNVLFIMLGLNDFRNGSITPDFTEWNSRIQEIYKSYKKAVPNGILALCTPCTSCGSLNNIQGDFTVRQNAVMWEVRKNIIDNFDKKEDMDFYVIDASAAIDNEGGYNRDSTGLQIGNPHPYPNYPQLGIPLAAFVQFIRNK